jgi:hypothetical protein
MREMDNQEPKCLIAGKHTKICSAVTLTGELRAPANELQR